MKKQNKKTKDCNNLIAQFAISYGGRDEILRAVKKIIENKIKPDEVNESLFASMLDTAETPEPDLIIRTSGEQRLSNFLIWQSATLSFILPRPCGQISQKMSLQKQFSTFKKDRGDSEKSVSLQGHKKKSSCCTYCFASFNPYYCKTTALFLFRTAYISVCCFNVGVFKDV